MANEKLGTDVVQPYSGNRHQDYKFKVTCYNDECDSPDSDTLETDGDYVSDDPCDKIGKFLLYQGC